MAGGTQNLQTRRKEKEPEKWGCHVFGGEAPQPKKRKRGKKGGIDGPYNCRPLGRKGGGSSRGREREKKRGGREKVKRERWGGDE